MTTWRINGQTFHVRRADTLWRLSWGDDWGHTTMRWFERLNDARSFAHRWTNRVDAQHSTRIRSSRCKMTDTSFCQTQEVVM